MGISKACARSRLFVSSSITDVTLQQNVLIFLLEKRPTARLCDFGLAWVDEEGSSDLMTSTFQHKGTAPYLSPELMCKNPKRDLKSDIWAWGCVVLEVSLESSSVHAILTLLASA